MDQTREPNSWSIYIKKKHWYCSHTRITLTQIDVQHLQNKYYRIASSSSDNTKTKGSIILISRKCSYTIDKISKDQTGRLSYICVTTGSRKIAFVSVYAPALCDPKFFPHLTSDLLTLTQYSFVIGGDMNSVFDLNLDRCRGSYTNVQKQASDMFRTFVETLNLTDIWHLHNPTNRDYDFFSTHHHTHSRIDYFLYSSEVSTLFKSITLEPAILSDHNLLITVLECSPMGEKSKWWKFNTSILQNVEFRIRIQILVLNSQTLYLSILVQLLTPLLFGKKPKALSGTSHPHLPLIWRNLGREELMI